MQRMQRKMGVFLSKSADESQVATLLQEYMTLDEMLGKLIDACKHWRDAWADIINHQLFLADQLDTLYQPINAASEFPPKHVPADTPRTTLERAIAYKAGYAEYKAEVLEEVNQIEQRLIKPAQDAKGWLKPMQKVIKKRQDRKMDYERYQGRYDAMVNKTKRSDRDNMAMMKHEADLERSTKEYEAADEHLRSVLPGIINAGFSIIPHLLGVQILIQNSILGHLYTTLHNFCQDHQLPSPPPDMDVVVAQWDADFTPLRQEIESGFQMLVHSKAVHRPMSLPESHSVTGLGIRNGFNRRKSSNNLPPAGGTSPRPSVSSASTSPRPSIGSQQAIEDAPPIPQLDAASKPKISSASKPRIGSSPGPSPAYLTPYEGARTPSPGSQPGFGYRRPSQSSSLLSAPASTSVPGGDYFSTRPRIPSNGSSQSGVATPLAGLTPGSISPGMAAMSIAGKKKPPPPPPAKKKPSLNIDYVTAMYDFEGQAGDLSFREGDRIRVTMRTESTQDWWQGEIRGTRGSFPANYCR